MVLRTIKDKIPLVVRQKYRPVLAKLPGVKGLLTKPFYEPSRASKGLSKTAGEESQTPINLGKLSCDIELDPHFALGHKPSSLKADNENLIIFLGSQLFANHVFGYHAGQSNRLALEGPISGILNYKGKKKKLRQPLGRLTDEIYLESFKPPQIKIYVDLTGYFKSVDQHVVYQSLQEVFSEFKDVKADVVFLTSSDSKSSLAKVKAQRVSNLKVREQKVTIEQAVSLRTSNPFVHATRKYRKVLGVQNQRILVLGWRILLKNATERRRFKAFVEAHPDTQFEIFEPIWDLPINAKTDIQDLPENCKIRGGLGYNALFRAGARFDGVYCLAGASLVEHERGQLITLNLLLQGLPFFGNVEPVEVFVQTTSAKPLTAYIYTASEKFKTNHGGADLNRIETHLTTVFKCLCEWPKTLYEDILPLAYEEVAQPISYEKGRVVITTHRLNHIENMAENILLCQDLDIPVTVVMNNLSEAEGAQLKKAMEFRGVDCDYFRDCKYALGYGITQAVVNSTSDYWLKIDDDDIYTAGHFFETYAALRIYQTRYCGRRIALYNLVEENTLYAHSSGSTLPSLRQNGRHVSGACMAGLSSLLRDYEIPRYSFYNMDVAYSEYLKEHNEARFIGSPFFLYVRRFDNAMHTWRFNFQEWAQQCVSLGTMPAYLRHSNISAASSADNHISDDGIDICFMHRAVPGTIGYGAGTWVPQEAIDAGYKVSEIVVKEPSAASEQLVTQFFERRFTRLYLNKIDVSFLSDILDRAFQRPPKVFHIINMSEIGDLTALIHEKFPSAKIVVEVRTPLLSNNENRRKDMSQALKLAHNIITPSQAVLETWASKLSFSEIVEKVTFVEPSINIPKSVNVDKLFARTEQAASAGEAYSMIYNGSIAKKRKIGGMIESILPALEQGKVSMTLCAQAADFYKLYPALKDAKNINFIGTVPNADMYEVLSQHDGLLAWIPEDSLYEDAWSTKIVEAALLGLDVIGSVTNGHQDMSSRGLFDVFYNNDPDSFSEALLKLQGKTKATRYADRQSAQEAAMNFTWAAKLQTYQSVWAIV